MIIAECNGHTADTEYRWQQPPTAHMLYMAPLAIRALGLPIGNVQA